MKRSLVDAETVALDSKRESAFLRSENLELKEKMVSGFYNFYNKVVVMITVYFVNLQCFPQQKELASICEQMEKDNQLYQSQLEAKEKMKVDLMKELQSSFNEITKLTSLIDGKVPKGIL